MKLKSDFITQEIDGTQFLVAVGGESFNGIVKSNATAAFIVDCLKNDTTEQAITDAMCAEYDAPRDVIAGDVHSVIETLRGIGAIEE
ncbi:MAG: PqqD family protein [Clostridia bacterium]|jgi:hypothetical protein|nr:PqqD family protein [Clostridia bacterium]